MWVQNLEDLFQPPPRNRRRGSSFLPVFKWCIQRTHFPYCKNILFFIYLSNYNYFIAAHAYNQTGSSPHICFAILYMYFLSPCPGRGTEKTGCGIKGINRNPAVKYPVSIKFLFINLILFLILLTNLLLG